MKETFVMFMFCQRSFVTIEKCERNIVCQGEEKSMALLMVIRVLNCVGGSQYYRIPAEYCREKKTLKTVLRLPFE